MKSNIIKFMLMLFVVMVFGYFFLNYTGFCFSEMRYLSDQEALDRAKLNFIETKLKIQEEYIGMQDVFIPFKDIEEFKQINPYFFKEDSDCCQIVYADDFMPTFWDRINGFANVKIKITYLQRAIPLSAYEIKQSEKRKVINMKDLMIDEQKKIANIKYSINGGVSYFNNCFVR